MSKNKFSIDFEPEKGIKMSISSEGFCVALLSIELASQKDIETKLIEIHRTKFIPAYEEVRNAAYENGALGVCLSGAGPSILAITSEKANPELDLEAMLDTFNKEGKKAEGFITRVGYGSKVEL